MLVNMASLVYKQSYFRQLIFFLFLQLTVFDRNSAVVFVLARWRRAMSMCVRPLTTSSCVRPPLLQYLALIVRKDDSQIVEFSENRFHP